MLAFTAVGAHCYNKVIKEMLQIGNAILVWRASATELKILGVEQNPKGSTVSMYSKLAKSVVNVLSPQTHPPTTNSGGVSPSKLADLRSKYIHQNNVGTT